MGTDTDIDWTANLLEQLTWHWEGQLRPRLDGLTDAEYLWEPVEGAWSLRAAGTGRAAMAAGGGALLADFEFPEPTPAPVTTIAWRMAHLLVGVLGARNASHFGGPPVDYFTKVYPSTAAEALAELDVEYARWTQGVAGLDASSLAQPVGPAEGDFAAHPWAGLILRVRYGPGVDDVGLHQVMGTDISAADLYAVLRLRAEVFVVEQDCPYLDPDGRDLDPNTAHLWLAAPDGTVAAYVRLLTEPTGGHRIGRVVTDPVHRGRRLASRLVDHALTVAQRPVVLDAQSHLVRVYARHGFEPEGEDFVEDGIHHTPMRLR